MRTLTVEWQDPHAALEQSRKLSGLEAMRAMIRGEIPRPPLSHLLGFSLREVSEGSAIFECTPGEQHYNPIGVVHGGLAATLLDSAMGCAVHTRLPLGLAYTTLEMKVNLVRAMTAQTGLVRATGTVVHFGRRSATAEGRLVDAAGKLLAHSSTTCLIFDPARG